MTYRRSAPSCILYTFVRLYSTHRYIMMFVIHVIIIIYTITESKIGDYMIYIYNMFNLLEIHEREKMFFLTVFT